VTDAERQRAYYLAHREHILASRKASWRSLNAEQREQKNRQRREYYAQKGAQARSRSRLKRAERRERDPLIVKRDEARRDPARRRAKQLVRNAIRRGDLTRKPCEVCGDPAQAHHDDYSKPLVVRWLCTVHHGYEHRKETNDRAVNAAA
jgi:hypothetical protein